MKVKDMIERLKQLNPNAEVLISNGGHTAKTEVFRHFFIGHSAFDSGKEDVREHVYIPLIAHDDDGQAFIVIPGEPNKPT